MMCMQRIPESDQQSRAKREGSGVLCDASEGHSEASKDRAAADDRVESQRSAGEAQRLLESGPVLPDIREAIGLLPKPLPYELDFKMH